MNKKVTSIEIYSDYSFETKELADKNRTRYVKYEINEVTEYEPKEILDSNFEYEYDAIAVTPNQYEEDFDSKEILVATLEKINNEIITTIEWKDESYSNNQEVLLLLKNDLPTLETDLKEELEKYEEFKSHPLSTKEKTVISDEIGAWEIGYGICELPNGECTDFAEEDIEHTIHYDNDDCDVIEVVTIRIILLTPDEPVKRNRKVKFEITWKDESYKDNPRVLKQIQFAKDFGFAEF